MLETQPAQHVEQTPENQQRPPVRLLASVSEVLPWTGATNLLLYAFMVLIARALGPISYGYFAALFSIVALINVVLAAFQTAAAHEVASLAMPDRARFLQQVWRPSLTWAAVIMAAFVAATPLMSSYLKVDSVLALASTSLVAALYFPWNILLGSFLGRQLFRRYGILTFLQAAARFAVLGILIVSRSPAILLASVAISMVPPILAGFRGGSFTHPGSGVSSPWRPSKLGISATLSSRAIALTVAVGYLTLGDVVVVRSVYTASEAGIYSGMALIGRVMMLIPAAVNAVLYPWFVASPNTDEKRAGLWKATAATAMLIGIVAAPVILVPDTVLRIVVGGAYDSAAEIVTWYVVATGLVALTSVIGFYQLARASTRYVVAIAIPHLVAQFVSPYIFDDSLRSLAIALTCVGSSFLLTSIGFTMFTRTRTRQATLGDGNRG